MIAPPLQGHSVVKDWRPNPNPPEMGEALPGGSWPAVDEVKIIVDEQIINRPVHNAYNASWYQYEAVTTPTGIVLHGEFDGRVKPFFPAGQGFSLDREVHAEAGGTLVIRNRFTNAGGPAIFPEMVEHSYLMGGKNQDGTEAAFQCVDGRTLRPEDLYHPKTPLNNQIDTRVNGHLNSQLMIAPGTCVFLPRGEAGHVVMLTAQITLPNADVIPVDEWYVYRLGEAFAGTDPSDNGRYIKDPDGWTAVEPVMSGMTVGPKETVSLEVRVHTFDSLSSYYAATTAHQSWVLQP